MYIEIVGHCKPKARYPKGGQGPNGLYFDIGRTSGSKFTHVVATGEYRPPLKGEWYISGAIPQGYHAPNDLGDAYFIARPCRCRVVSTLVEVEG